MKLIPADLYLCRMTSKNLRERRNENLLMQFQKENLSAAESGDRSDEYYGHFLFVCDAETYIILQILVCSCPTGGFQWGNL